MFHSFINSRFNEKSKVFEELKGIFDHGTMKINIFLYIFNYKRIETKIEVTMKLQF